MKKQQKNINGKIPPSAPDIEDAIIGGIMIDSRAVDEVLTIIKSPDVFYKEKNKYIFEAVQQLVNDQSKIDLLTLGNRLRKNGHIELIGGDYHLVELLQKVSSTAHIAEHCRIILQMWVKRSVIGLSSTQMDDAYNETVDIFNLLETTEKNLDATNEMLNTGGKGLNFSDALQKVVDRVQMLTDKGPSEIVGCTTGFKTLDNFTGGWANSDLVIIAARPGMGKTSLILKNVSEIALRGDAVGMFSLEMSTEQLTARILAINSQFHLSQIIKKGFEKPQYFVDLLKVQSDLNNLPIYIDDNAGLTMQQMQMTARMWKRKYNIKALFVDYIQLMGGDGSNKSGNREQEIAHISRKLKQTAKELNIPVIALSQLSRSAEKHPDKRPRLPDLRESGAIEQDADTVIFIYRPEYYDIEPDNDLQQLGGNTEILFAKYRAGSLETKALWWQGDKTKFCDIDDKPNYKNDDTPY